MIRAFIAAVSGAAAILAMHDSPRTAASRLPAAAIVRRLVCAELDSLDRALATLDASRRDVSLGRQAFRRARDAYKRLEPVLAYYAPPVVDALNGIEAQEGDDNPDAGSVVPHGFQRIEPTLYAELPNGSHDQAATVVHDEVVRMRLFVARFRPTIAFIAPRDAELVEIARLELARVATLGITGIDATLSGDAMRESAAALDGVRAVFETAAPPTMAVRTFAARLTAAAADLRRHPDFATFDRFTFVTRYSTPAFQALTTVGRRDTLASARLRRTWPAAAPNVYDARAFDVMAFAPHGAAQPTPATIALGAALFVDARLSGSGTRACASCHVLARGFTDGRARAEPLRAGDTTTLRHTPKLRYAAWQPTLLADGRAVTLEAQIDTVLASRAEMGSSIDAAVVRIGLSAAVVRGALAAYLRSLARFDTPFDRAMRGEHGAMSAAARRGFNLFMGRAGCGTCHFAPLFNGAAPPDFVRSSPEVVGVGASTDGHTLDADLGRGAIDRLAGHAHAFTTPTVRDAALGGPYMHNGALHTLNDVLDFYDGGGAAGRVATLPNVTLSDRPLHLSPRDRSDLTAFLDALTTRDRTMPVSLPFTSSTR